MKADESLSMDPLNQNPDKELLLRVKTIMVLRVVFLTGFLGSVLLFQQRTGFPGPVLPIKLVLASAYFFSLLYALIFNFRPDRLASLAMTQMVGDLFVVGGIIYTTGGLDSPLSFLYLFVIIATSIILPRAACYLVASGASILYGLMIDLEYFGIIHPVNFLGEPHITFESGYAFYIVSLNIASYYSVAYLSSILSNRLRAIKEELDVKSIDLKELQAFNENIIQNMGNGLITTTEEGFITSMNRAAENITGYSQMETIGKSCGLILSFSALNNFFQDSGSETLPFELQGECTHKNGTVNFMKMKISHLAEGEDLTKGFICVFEDLTEIRKMQDAVSQTEQLAAVGRFSAGLAHEIRNPLASISGSIQVLSKVLSLNSTSRRLMDIVMKETDRLNAIVSDFLNYSQPRKTRKTLVDMNQIIEEVIILLKNSGEYGPNIDIEYKNNTMHLLWNCDEAQIKQALWNLCINGVQSMPHGGRLSITLDQALPGGKGKIRRGIVLSVKDQGCGIPKDKIKNVFDPFFTTKENGVGLGLPTVHQFVVSNGGSIDIDSSADEGTCLTLFFPEEELFARNAGTFGNPGKDSIAPQW